MISSLSRISQLALRRHVIDRKVVLGAYRSPISTLVAPQPVVTSEPVSTLVVERTTSFLGSLWDVSIWFLKRTFQPSVVRRKRKLGFLVRQRTVGGRRVLKRRKLKGRKRLAG